MRMIDDSNYGLAFRADHCQDFHPVDASMVSARGFTLDLTMGTFDIGTFEIINATG